MGPSDDAKGVVVSQLVEAVKDISALPECKNASKRICSNLVRRIKLLSPLFDEIYDRYEELRHDEVEGLQALKVCFDTVKEFIKSLNEGSKILQVYIYCIDIYCTWFVYVYVFEINLVRFLITCFFEFLITEILFD